MLVLWLAADRYVLAALALVVVQLGLPSSPEREHEMTACQVGSRAHQRHEHEYIPLSHGQSREHATCRKLPAAIAHCPSETVARPMLQEPFEAYLSLVTGLAQTP